MTVRLTPRVTLLIIVALFFLPMMAAWLMHTGTIGFRPQSTRNLGQLVQPLQPISWAGAYLDGAADQPVAEVFDGHWVILHAVPRPCSDACLRSIRDLRQVHRATGRQQLRIRLALLHDLDGADGSRNLQEVYSAFHLLENPDGSLWSVLERVAARSGPTASARGSTYLIDPLGNIMMFYAAGYDPNDLKKDLNRLLTWSKLDEQS